MKYILAAALLVSFSLSSIAQADCDLTVADLPEIHDLRLGTSRREVEKIYGITPTNVFYKATPNTKVRNLENIWFGFYQDSLTVLEFDYDRETAWKNVREFATHLQFSLKLPMDSWVFVDRTEAMMKCRGFNVSISSVRNTLSLTDTFAKNASTRNSPLGLKKGFHGQQM